MTKEPDEFDAEIDVKLPNELEMTPGNLAHFMLKLT
jgi:hypothetical protein